MGAPRLLPLRGDDPARLGPYRLIGRVGSGGMGRVYLGRTVSGRLVAVKTLLAEGEVSETDRRRFAREVALARRVNGVFTVAVLDADAETDRPWMATEYVPAPSLAELVQEAGVLPPSAVRWIAAGMAEALVDLHGAGIVHRDVKPGNVLLPQSGPRLIDFGISHALDLTRTTLTLGTIAFTSPEQARGEASTPASDVYSTGTTLFHLATARPPYAPGSDAFRLLAQVQRADVAFDGLPRELDDLIRPLLTRDPSSRPTPQDILSAFEREPTGGSELLPAPWTSLIRARHEYVPPTEAGDAPAVDATAASAERAADPVPALHSAPTRTALPKPAPAQEPMPRPATPASPPPPAGHGGRRLGRRVRALAAAAVAIVVSTGGYLIYDRMAEDGLSVADCLSNTRTTPGTYEPGSPREVDCGDSAATLVVMAQADPAGPCPDTPQPSEHWPGSNLCVGPRVVEGDCLNETRYDRGYVPSSVLWTAGSCGGPSPRLKVAAVRASNGSTKESVCEGAYSSGSGRLWTDSNGSVYCLERI
ncbi:serine/threonine-protein kinase [Streptomyces sp. NPDC002463]|uniref:serine/threonine-protein kinase n=1 Tax=Streptomyces sp. NPDC002463 TaxID=3364645 RepID=UPI0036BC9721